MVAVVKQNIKRLNGGSQMLFFQVIKLQRQVRTMVSRYSYSTILQLPLTKYTSTTPSSTSCPCIPSPEAEAWTLTCLLCWIYIYMEMVAGKPLPNVYKLNREPKMGQPLPSTDTSSTNCSKFTLPRVSRHNPETHIEHHFKTLPSSQDHQTRMVSPFWDQLTV